MGDTKSLYDQAAIDKIKELADGKMCLFCTYEDGQIVSRPMSTQGVDEDGTMWFFSRKDSEKNDQINEDDTVHLMYMDTGKQQYLSLSGRASIVADKQKTEELWNPVAKAWFEKGKDDPALSLLRVTPQDGHYWDTKSGKLISFIKIAVAALTGKQMDGGVDGDLKV